MITEPMQRQNTSWVCLKRDVESISSLQICWDHCGTIASGKRSCYTTFCRKSGKPSNYEVVTNKKSPNFHKVPTSYILPFGCYAVVLTDGKLRTKLAPAGELAIYLGICLTDGHWGARVWLLKSRRVIVTTNFRADISYYPFQS